MSETLDRLFLDFSARKLSLLCSRIETCLDTVNDEQAWMRGSRNENAIGNMVLHLCGNVRQWIVSEVGGAPDTRERDAEFAAQGGMGARELAGRLRAAVEEATAVLGGLKAERLPERVVIQNYEVTVLEAIYHVVEHFSMHTGQVIFATKMLAGGYLGFYRHLKTKAAHNQQTP